MSRETVRQTITTQLEALRGTWSAYALQVQYDNRAVDMDKLTNPLLRAEVEFTEGFQVDLNATPLYRGLGYLRLDAVVKENTGSAKANALLEHFYPKLHMRDFFPVRFRAVRHLKSEPLEKGFRCFAVMIPFYFDSSFVA